MTKPIIRASFLLLSLGFLLMAQESTSPMVAIPLIACDSHHRPTNLTVESLVITDQKIPVTRAVLVRGTDLPVELGLLIDDSNSQRSAELAATLKAARQFVSDSISGSKDRVFPLDFDTSPRATEWLTKEQAQTTGLRVRIGGATAIYDALAMACKERMGPRDWQKPTRRALVLISDGEDNQSHVTRDEAVLDALEAGAVIFTINTDLTGTNRGAKTMQALAETTGGESFNEVGAKDASKVFASIKEMMDGMYYLRYPLPDAAQSTLHAVEVRLGPKEKLRLFYARKYLWDQTTVTVAR